MNEQVGDSEVLNSLSNLGESRNTIDRLLTESSERVGNLTENDQTMLFVVSLAIDDDKSGNDSLAEEMASLMILNPAVKVNWGHEAGKANPLDVVAERFREGCDEASGLDNTRTHLRCRVLMEELIKQGGDYELLAAFQKIIETDREENSGNLFGDFNFGDHNERDAFMKSFVRYFAGVELKKFVSDTSK